MKGIAAIGYIVYRVSDKKVIATFGYGDGEARAKKLAKGLNEESTEYEYKVGDELWAMQNLRRK